MSNTTASLSMIAVVAGEGSVVILPSRVFRVASFDIGVEMLAATACSTFRAVSAGVAQGLAPKVLLSVSTSHSRVAGMRLPGRIF